MKLGHVHLKVRSLARALPFYERAFGLRLRERAGRFAFLSGGDAHHELALQEVGDQALIPQPHSVGLYHVAFEVPDANGLRQAWRTLREMGIEASAVDHGISHALYFSDPDGNGLEIYLDTRTTAGGASDWRGRSERLRFDEDPDAAGAGAAPDRRDRADRTRSNPRS